MGQIQVPSSFNYNDNARDVQRIFEQILQKAPVFSALIPFGQIASNTKAEWVEDQLTPISTTIASFDTDGDGTGINVVSTTGIKVGSIIRFEAAAGASRTVQVKVASVDSLTDLTVVRPYGGTSEETLVVGDVAFLISSPVSESSDADTGVGYEPGTNFNYMEIFSETAGVTTTQIDIENETFVNALAMAEQNAMAQMSYKLNEAAIYGRRVLRSSSENGTMGGLLQFLEGGNIEATGGNLSATQLNNALKDIFEDGGFSDNYKILCNSNQATRISALNTAGNNPRIEQASRLAGNVVSQFLGDLPVQTGFVADIVVDPKFPKDKVAIVDMNRVEFAALRNHQLKSMDATTPGSLQVRTRLTGQWTLRVKNGQKAHALITGLNV